VFETQKLVFTSSMFQAGGKKQNIPENYWFQNRNINDAKGCGEKFSL